MSYEATIRQELAKLKPEVRKPWRTFEALPYLYATEDAKAVPWQDPQVGRFDYLPAMGYIKALHPVAVEALLAELDRLRGGANPWKEAVTDGLVCAHILNANHEANPKKALSDLIAWECSVALDPAVSQQAADLVASKPAARTDQEIVDQTEHIAALLGIEFEGSEMAPGKHFRNATNPKAIRCWQMAVKIQEFLTQTNPEDAVSAIEE